MKIIYCWKSIFSKFSGFCFVLPSICNACIKEIPSELPFFCEISDYRMYWLKENFEQTNIRYIHIMNSLERISSDISFSFIDYLLKFGPESCFLNENARMHCYSNMVIFTWSSVQVNSYILFPHNLQAEFWKFENWIHSKYGIVNARWLPPLRPPLTHKRASRTHLFKF